MKFIKFDYQQTKEVIALFTNVFSKSEGQNEGRLIGQLVTELIATTSSSDLLGFVALSEDKIVACIFFSRLTFQNDTDAFILSPVAVTTTQQGEGIGQKLINFGIEQLKNNEVALVFTYGDPNFYAKVGFKHISEQSVKPPLTLTYPEGWLGQSITGDPIHTVSGTVRCVEALNKQEYW